MYHPPFRLLCTLCILFPYHTPYFDSFISSLHPNLHILLTTLKSTHRSFFILKTDWDFLPPSCGTPTYLPLMRFGWLDIKFPERHGSGNSSGTSTSSSSCPPSPQLQPRHCVRSISSRTTGGTLEFEKETHCLLGTKIRPLIVIRLSTRLSYFDQRYFPLMFNNLRLRQTFHLSGYKR